MTRGVGSDIVGRLRKHVAVLVAVIVVGAALVFTVFGEVGIVSAWRVNRNEQRLEEENARLREDIGRLRAEVARLRTNPAYIEEIARKELGLIGKQENVIVLERKPDGAARDPAPGGTKRR